MDDEAFTTNTPVAGVGSSHRRSVRSLIPDGTQRGQQHDVTNAIALASTFAREMARAPGEGPDISMTFSRRFYLFTFMALLASLGTLVVIVWMVAGAG